MQIKHRIHARKLVLTYFYRHGFLFRIEKNDVCVDEVVRLTLDVEKTQETSDQVFAIIDEFVHVLRQTDITEKVKYLTDYCFDNRGWENIDMDYALDIISEYDVYRSKVEEHINKYITSFTFDQMDLIDQCVFILGYIEYIKIKTPKEILLNEMVELSKRYGDGGSGKLINGIMHNIIEEIDQISE